MNFKAYTRSSIAHCNARKKPLVRVTARRKTILSFFFIFEIMQFFFYSTTTIPLADEISLFAYHVPSSERHKQLIDFGLVHLSRTKEKTRLANESARTIKLSRQQSREGRKKEKNNSSADAKEWHTHSVLANIIFISWFCGFHCE